jgi:hypothetical protein
MAGMYDVRCGDGTVWRGISYAPSFITIDPGIQVLLRLLLQKFEAAVLVFDRLCGLVVRVPGYISTKCWEVLEQLHN